LTNTIPFYIALFKRVFFLLLLSICTSLFAQNNKNTMSFEHLSIEEGLNSVSVTDILQDHQGFMWFAGTSGLNKYDAYTITNYHFDSEKPNGISDDVITTLFEDSTGILWIGTERGGLNKYDRETDSFFSYQNQPSDSTSISHNHILKIYEDSHGVFWIGTQGGGLNKMDREKGTFFRYKSNPSDKNSLPNNSIYAILEDSSEQLWVGSLKGISLFNRSTEEFNTYINNPLEKDAIGVYAICEDKQGVLWVGTYRGLFKFNKEDKTFTSYIYDNEDESKNIVYRITEDGFGNLWTSVWGSGLSKFDKLSGTFTTYKHRPQDKNSLGDGSVLSIYEDRSNILWIATGLGGVSIYKPKKTSNFIHHRNNTNNNSLSSGIITSINESLTGDIWLTNFMGVVDKIEKNGNIIHYKKFKKDGQESHPSAIFDLLERENKDILIGTYRNLYKLNKSNNTFEHQSVSYNQFFNNVSQVRSIEEDKKGTIWLGTIENGLLRYDEKEDKYTSFQYAPSDSTSISSNSITKVYEDPFGTLWIATIDGLNKMNKDSTFVRYKNNPLDTTSISNNYINNIYKDHFGSLWIGTNSGLDVFDEKTETFRHFTKNDGLPENTVYSILEDNSNNLWISTNNFLTKFNLNTETFKNFNKGNGMPIDEFYSKASLKGSNGKMYFGGINGLIEFHPDSIKINTYKPPIIITDFKISNQSVNIKKDSITKAGEIYLHKNINVTDTIVISYLDNIFSFEFAALDYFHSPNNQYAYRMKGFNDEWIYTNATNRSATYTNLDPGSYVFEVKGSNNDDLWNDTGKSIIVIITPPWWKTNWAYFLYISGFLASLFGFVQWRGLRLKRERKTLIERVKIKTKDLADKNVLLDNQNIQLQDQATQLQELDKIKASFFTNISHEFRTPLTVITGLANKHISKNENEISTQDSKTIKRNAQRLLQLINQLLDLSKLENSEVKLNILKTDILYFTKKVTLLYESLAKDKQIKVFFNGKVLSKSLPTEKIDLYFDKDKMQKIITNLISNAIKFTPEGGKIKLSVKKLNSKNIEPQINIEVSNTGNLIPKNKLPYIFDRFYQVENNYTSENEGTGIGLALVKELVELHNGTINVKSSSTETTFILKIPYNEKLLLKNNRLIKESGVDTFKEDTIVDIEHQTTSKKDDKLELTPNGSNLLDLLIVEDNPDLRNYITGLLDQDYNITQAINGLEGLDMAKNAIPDLIISDVMMPKMDGYELCEKLKTDLSTDHIPIILLTAKATHENKLEGLQTGADAYLTKPFDEKELKVRIKNLIDHRKKIQKKCQNESFSSSKDVKVTSVQQKFIQRIKDVIENNIDNDQFSVEDLGETIGMSRSQVHRKLKAITDQSATRFIRNYRLHRAADLLSQDSGNISEIAYQVGFSSRTYFSKSFQELFGMTPSDYKKQN